MLYGVLFIISFGLTYFIKNYAAKKSLLAAVNERSLHVKATPYGGGIAIMISWSLGLLYLYMYDKIASELFYALIMGVILSIVSYADDLFELSAKFRLFVQGAVAIGGLIALGGLESLDFKVLVIENQIITNGVAFLLIVWFINVYNFIDGIDGYAGSEALFLAFGGLLFFGGEHFLVLAASVGGFLIWNWHRAKIFMGDAGSTLLGYSVAIFSIYYANEQSLNLWLWVTLFSLFLFDALFTLFRRYKNGEEIFSGHKKHAYQRLVQSGWSHRRVVLWGMGLNVIIFLLLYLFENIFISLFLSMVLCYMSLKFVDSKKAFS